MPTPGADVVRLEILERGHRTRVRPLVAMVARLSGVPMSDVPKTLLYRLEFLGRPLLGLSAEAMRSLGAGLRAVSA